MRTIKRAARPLRTCSTEGACSETGDAARRRTIRACSVAEDAVHSREVRGVRSASSGRGRAPRRKTRPNRVETDSGAMRASRREQAGRLRQQYTSSPALRIVAQGHIEKGEHTMKTMLRTLAAALHRPPSPRGARPRPHQVGASSGEPAVGEVKNERGEFEGFGGRPRARHRREDGPRRRDPGSRFPRRCSPPPSSGRIGTWRSRRSPSPPSALESQAFTQGYYDSGHGARHRRRLPRFDGLADMQGKVAGALATSTGWRSGPRETRALRLSPRSRPTTARRTCCSTPAGPALTAPISVQSPACSSPS